MQIARDAGRGGAHDPDRRPGHEPGQRDCRRRRRRPAPEAYQLPLLIFGLVVSIPLIIVGSTLLIKLMDRFPIIITLGAALLGFLAGEMVVSDPSTAAWFTANFPDAGVYVGLGCALLVVVLGKWLQRRAEARVEQEH